MTAKHKIVHTFALFGSFTTLLCCALPALFVSLGAGAALIGLVGAVPQLVWLSEHKIGLFIFAGLMLTLSGVSRYLTRNAPCPIDAKEARACKRLRRIGLGIFCFSLLMYAVGFFFAFIAQYLIK
jgi:hypothetical protein